MASPVGTSYWLAWLPAGGRWNFRGNGGGIYNGLYPTNSLPASWPSGGGTGSVNAVIWGE